MNRDEANKELIRLVEIDYQRTATFITGVLATSSGLRGWAVTIWLAVTGLAFGRSEPALAALAAIVAAAFYVVDGYHAWLYGQGLRHALHLEDISERYFNSLGRDFDDNEAQLELDVALQSHRFGVYHYLSEPSLRDLRYVRPLVVFRVFYPLLFLVAVVAAFAIKLGAQT